MAVRASRCVANLRKTGLVSGGRAKAHSEGDECLCAGSAPDPSNKYSVEQLRRGAHVRHIFSLKTILMSPMQCSHMHAKL